MSERQRVLIVDDMVENLEVMAGALEPAGYRIETAPDGKAAVEAALRDPPDLILMDVNMPRLSGFEACRQIKADPRTHLVPIVLVTALVAREDRIAGIAAGCDDFLTKPVDFEQLLARSRVLLRTKALVDELEVAENVFVSLATVLDAKDAYTRSEWPPTRRRWGATSVFPPRSGGPCGGPVSSTTWARSVSPAPTSTSRGP